MKKLPLLVYTLIALTPFGAWNCVTVHAEEEAPAAPADSAKKGEGGEAPKEGDAKDDKKAKKSGDVSGGRFSGDPVYVHLAPMTLPILGMTGPEQLVTIQITVEVKDFDTVDDMHARMPKVMDTLLQVLYGGLSQGSLRNGRLADIAKVKTKAMTALQGMEGSDNIKDVLIVNMSQRLL